MIATAGEAGMGKVVPKGAIMNETPNTRTAELFDAMVAAYETWAEPLSARLAQVALKRTSVRAGDCVLDIGAGTSALAHQAAGLGARVTAIDLSSGMVAQAAEHQGGRSAPTRYGPDDETGRRGNIHSRT
jgi:ubiquinone/menaquinone biosynthesis C-methylase UbiE